MSLRLFVCLLTLLLPGFSIGADLQLGKNCVVQFAPVEQGRKALTERDAYVQRMSPFDRAVRLKSAAPVTEQQFLRHTAAQVLEWTPEDKQKLGEVIQTVHNRLKVLKLPTPDKVLFVKTSGEEEGQAAYCRGAAIVLPTNVLQRTPGKLERLITHEFFHVLSNQNPGWRQRLYAVVGFLPCDEIALPEKLRNRRITNPDAPATNYFTTIQVDDEEFRVVPVLYSSAERYDEKQGGNLFRYLTFRLMAVEKGKDRWQPILQDGKPRLWKVSEAPSYYERIGRNTKYIIHPEEVLADNFVLLVTDKTEVATPRILQGMKEVIETEGR